MINWNVFKSSFVKNLIGILKVMNLMLGIVSLVFLIAQFMFFSKQ